jgi:hypothetical protein
MLSHGRRSSIMRLRFPRGSGYRKSSNSNSREKSRKHARDAKQRNHKKDSNSRHKVRSPSFRSIRDPGRSRRFERRTSRHVPEASFASCHLRLITVLSLCKSHRSARFVGAVSSLRSSSKEILSKCFSLTCVEVVADCC